jgi:hypothetical protein
MDQEQSVQIANAVLNEEYSRSIFGEIYPDVQATAAASQDLVNLVRDFVIDKSLKAQLEYFLQHQPPTPKAAHKIKTFFLFCINAQFVTSNIPTREEMIEQRRLQAQFRLIEAQLPLGLTKYDMNDTYIHTTSLIEHLYRNQLLRARNGFTMKRVGTKTFEAGGFDQKDEQEKSEQGILKRMGVVRR